MLTEIGEAAAQELDNLVMTIRQFFCQHNSREGRWTPRVDDRGKPFVEGYGICLDCGKRIPPPEIPHESKLKLLDEAKVIRGAKEND